MNVLLKHAYDTIKPAPSKEHVARMEKIKEMKEALRACTLPDEHVKRGHS